MRVPSMEREKEQMKLFATVLKRLGLKKLNSAFCSNFLGDLVTIEKTHPSR